MEENKKLPSIKINIREPNRGEDRKRPNNNRGHSAVTSRVNQLMQEKRRLRREQAVIEAMLSKVDEKIAELEVDRLQVNSIQRSLQAEQQQQQHQHQGVQQPQVLEHLDLGVQPVNKVSN